MSLLTPPKDELRELARAAGAGDGQAASTLITIVGASMLRSVRKVIGAAHPEVDDVMQDAVIALISALRGFRGDCHTVHFANRVAVLSAMAARRRSNTRKRFTDPDASLIDVAEAKDKSPLESVLAARRRALVRQLLDDMPEPIAEAVALHYVLGYTVDEIAVAASVPANTVWSRLRLGKQRLKKALAEENLATAEVEE